MMKNIIKIIAVASAVAFPSINVQKNEAKPTTGYKIYNDQYVSEILIGDIMHDYIGRDGVFELGAFEDSNTGIYFDIGFAINSGGVVYDSWLQFKNKSQDLIDWDRTGLSYDLKYDDWPKWRYSLMDKTNFCLYLKRPLKAFRIYTWTEKYLAYTSPAREFAGGYDGFIPSFYYTSIFGNEDYISKINSLTGLLTGKVWQSGNVASLRIEKEGFIIQDYYVFASVEEWEQLYTVYLSANAKSKDGQKSAVLNISELGYVDLSDNTKRVGSYNFPQPVSTLETRSGYYNLIRSGGAYGITESIKNYEEGYKDGQGNPTFKSFIVSAFEACGAFFALPVLGQHITIGALIGSFVGLGALFLLIRLFR